MKTNKKYFLSHRTTISSKWVLFMFLLGIVVAAWKNPAALEPSFEFINSPQGSALTFEYPPGEKEKAETGSISAWNRGSFLEGNYWRTIKIGTPKGVLTFRLNFPNDVPPDASVVGKKHNLRTGRLLLRNSQVLEGISAELFMVSSIEFNDQINAAGTVQIYQSIDKDGESYDIAGEIEAIIINREGVPVKITGHFWKKIVD